MSASNSQSDISRVVQGTERARKITDGKVRDIQRVNASLRMLAFNALIEAKRVGELGAGFGVVADEVKGISTSVDSLAQSLSSELVAEISSLETTVKGMIAQANGKRLMDLSLNAIELMDRNLFERTCDVRWWATDSALVDAADNSSAEDIEYACKRLGVILSAYTVYVDLWLCDMNGKVIANGRPERFSVIGEDVSDKSWYRNARQLHSGDDYTVADVTEEYLLQNTQIATYATTVRKDGDANGEPIGVLGVHFDWKPQAEAIVNGIRLSDDEAERSSILLVDNRNTVIASNDPNKRLGDKVDLKCTDPTSGYYSTPKGETVGYHLTPGYETYEGLGWKGVIIQRPS